MNLDVKDVAKAIREGKAVLETKGWCTASYYDANDKRCALGALYNIDQYTISRNTPHSGIHNKIQPDCVTCQALVALASAAAQRHTPNMAPLYTPEYVIYYQHIISGYNDTRQNAIPILNLFETVAEALETADRLPIQGMEVSTNDNPSDRYPVAANASTPTLASPEHRDLGAPAPLPLP